MLLQLFFKHKGIVDEIGYILFVKKNAIVVLIPKFGLEGTVFFEEKGKQSLKMQYNEEVQNLFPIFLQLTMVQYLKFCFILILI